MRKSTRGALAAGAAALLLFGGMGTWATWTDEDAVPGTAIDAGHLELVDAACAGWLIDGDPFDPASIKIVPGSKLTQICTFEVDLLGHNLKATFDVTAPGFTGTNDLTTALQTSAEYKSGGSAITGATELVDGEVITATLTVTLPTSATNAVQDLTATLDSITVTATQA
jgi:alternate signal-mediated exported protein